MPLNRKLHILWRAALILFLLSPLPAWADLRDAGGKFGFTDFASYWTACSLFREGKNPYNAETFKERAAAVPTEIIGARDLSPVWNPPWALSILCPFMTSDVEKSGHIWMVINLALLGIALKAGISLFWKSGQGSILRPLAAGALFAPTLQVIGYGQISLVALCAALSSLALARRGRWMASGVLMFASLIKPHILLGVYGLWASEILKKRCRAALLGFGGAALVLSLFAEYRCPGIFEGWADRAGGTISFRTPTLVSLLRQSAMEFLGRDLPMLTAILPAIILLAFAVAARKIELDQKLIIPLSFAASAIAAPYGWFFDFTILLVLPLSLACLAEEFWDSDRRAALNIYSIIIGTQLLISAIKDLLPNHDQFFWVPELVLTAWFCGIGIMTRAARS